jgi:hypothetical protein
MAFSTCWKGTVIFIVQVCMAIFQMPNPLLQLSLTHYTWPINAMEMPKNFSCSKSFCIQKPHDYTDGKTSGIFDKAFQLILT